MTEDLDVMFYWKETLQGGEEELTQYRICDMYPPYHCVIEKGTPWPRLT